jgi:hypothetical protein
MGQPRIECQRVVNSVYETLVLDVLKMRRLTPGKGISFYVLVSM